MGITYATTATAYPVSVQQTKLHTHVDENQENINLSDYIGAATKAGQVMLDRQFVTATLRLTLDDFPCPTRNNPQACLYVPRPPLQSISSIGYVQAEDGTTATMASSDYIVDTASEPGRVMPAFGRVWPISRYQINAVTVTFVAGYGAPSAVPKNIKTWIMSNAAAAYRFREPITELRMDRIGLIDNLLTVEEYGRV